MFITAGFLFIGIGIVGIILPVLPTTVFFLIASFCFAKGSKKFDNWFKQTKLYKKYLHGYVTTRALSLPAKIRILIISDLMTLLSFFMVDIIFVRVILVLLTIYKYYYFIYKIKTSKPIGKVSEEA